MAQQQDAQMAGFQLGDLFDDTLPLDTDFRLPHVPPTLRTAEDEGLQEIEDAVHALEDATLEQMAAATVEIGAEEQEEQAAEPTAPIITRYAAHRYSTGNIDTH